MDAAEGGGGRVRTWQDELASLVEADPSVPAPSVGRYEEGAAVGEESLKDQVRGFLEASGEMLQELGRSCRDIAQQSFEGIEDSYVGKKLRRPVSVAKSRLEFLNDYLPEDRDPKHAWPVVIFVLLLALSALTVNKEQKPPVELPKIVHLHPPTATRIQLPDGRHLAYREQGVSAARARFSMITPHSFLSSRLAGIPGIKDSLLQEFGVRLISYDLPGFGESDPHHSRDLNSSAQDMFCLANALDVDKFWVVGYSSGAMHAWAAVRYIPDRLAGAAMFAPTSNPYDTSMTNEEKHRTWEKWSTKRKFMYMLARRSPSFLRFFYNRSFLSGHHGKPETWLSMSLRKKDKALIEEKVFRDFWERDIEESIRQRDPTPFLEEAILQVSKWGFSLSDVQVQKKLEAKGFLPFIKSLYGQIEREWSGFLGPIHIWQGMDDLVTPPSMTEFARRVIPGATVHRLLGEGHFSYFFFCDECHRHIFSTLFGTPKGPLELVLDEITPDDYIEEMYHNCTEQE